MTQSSPQHKTNWLFLISLFAGLITLYVLGTWVQYQIQQQKYDEYRVRRDAQRAQENQILGEKLDTYAMPIINAIERYKKENGKYPTDLAALVPTYLPEAPKAVFGEEVFYGIYGTGPNPFGQPFYFGFSGSVSILSFSSWDYSYCPVAVCNIDGYKAMYRINENWIYIYDSW